MRGSKILLVDDEEVFTRNMSKLLTTRGYKVITASGGDQAIRLLEEQSVDVIVLDSKMPGMDGLTTLKEIRKLGLFTQTLILTGHGSIDSALEAIKLGAYDYLTKPCEIGELVAKIEDAWGNKEESTVKDMTGKPQNAEKPPGSVFEVFPSKKETA